MENEKSKITELEKFILEVLIKNEISFHYDFLAPRVEFMPYDIKELKEIISYCEDNNLYIKIEETFKVFQK